MYPKYSISTNARLNSACVKEGFSATFRSTSARKLASAGFGDSSLTSEDFSSGESTPPALASSRSTKVAALVSAG